jgi:putative DNA primase/helicase
VAGLKHIPNWRATINALEGKAAEFNHMLLPLDEIGQADPQTVGVTAYMLGNEQGKGRMDKKLNNVKPKTWLLLFLSTGEVAMIRPLAKVSSDRLL